MCLIREIKNAVSKQYLLYVALFPHRFLIEGPTKLELKMSSVVWLDVQKIMWTLDTNKT